MNNNTKGKKKQRAKAHVGANGVVSCNYKRNSVMRVYQNRGDRVSSLTCHEPLDSSKPMIFPNHKYVEYRRGGGGNTSAATV